MFCFLVRVDKLCFLCLRMNEISAMLNERQMKQGNYAKHRVWFLKCCWNDLTRLKVFPCYFLDQHASQNNCLAAVRLTLQSVHCSSLCCHGLRQRSPWCRGVLCWWTHTKLSDYSSIFSIQSFVSLWDTISLDEQRALLCLPFTCSHFWSPNSIYKYQIWLLCGSQTKAIKFVVIL